MICEFDNFLFNNNAISFAFILETITASCLRKVLLLKAICVALSFLKAFSKTNYSYTLREKWIHHQDVQSYKFHLSASTTTDVSPGPTYEDLSVSLWTKIFLMCFSCWKFLPVGKFSLARGLSSPPPPRQCFLVLRSKNSLIVLKENRKYGNQKSIFE